MKLVPSAARGAAKPRLIGSPAIPAGASNFRILIRYSDRDRLGVNSTVAIRDLHRDVVDVVRAFVGGRFEVGGRGKSQRTRRGIDGELGRIIAATDRVASGLTGIRIGRRNRGHRGRVLDNRDRRRGPTSVGGDHRRIVNRCDVYCCSIGRTKVASTNIAIVMYGQREGCAGARRIRVIHEFSVLVPVAPRKLFIWVTVPVIVSDELPLPLTLAPLFPTVAVSVPSPTANGSSHLARARIDIADRKASALKAQNYLLFGAVTSRGNGGHRRIVDVANRHRDRLGINSTVAIRDLHRDVVDVVRAYVGGRFEVGGRDKSQRTRRGIDGELGRSCRH